MSSARPVPAVRRAVTGVLALMLALAGNLGLAAAPASAAYARPTGLAATSTATTSVRLSWTPVKKAPAYRIKYDDNSKMRSPAYVKATGAGVEISGLKPGKTYWFRVRVISAKSANLSAYGSTLKVTTRKTGDFDLLSPTGLAATAVTDNTIGLTWAARGDSENYRVRWATSRTLGDESFLRVTGTTAELPDLTPGVTYYVSVRSITAEGVNLSQYSPMVAVKTTGKASFAPPTGLAARATATTTASVSWKAVAGATRYRIKYDATPWTDSQYASSAGASVVLTGLKAFTTYSVKVRILDEYGDFASDYSEAVTVTTPSAPAPLRVASYNVRCATCSSSRSEERPWTERRDAVVATIDAADPDVIGFQEAQQSWISEDGKLVNRAQFEDLLSRLGEPWAITNAYRNNCVKSTTPTDCVYKDRGATNGTRIMYRTDRLTLVEKGAVALPLSPEHTYPRWLAWAIFTQKSTGRTFFFGDIHFEPNNDTGDSLLYYNLRKREADTVVAAIARLNPDKLPVVLVGDPNSNKWEVPSNAPYDIFVASGLVDPLGNTYRSSSPVGATVEKRIGTSFNSYNNFERSARRSGNVNGTYTDYILTTPMRVSEWETAAKVDSSNNFVGVIPSDHNLLRATVWLP
jgi:endonuclease/exonuclease/phosphatase family metal-dependent hydrolase